MLRWRCCSCRCTAPHSPRHKQLCQPPPPPHPHCLLCGTGQMPQAHSEPGGRLPRLPQGGHGLVWPKSCQSQGKKTFRSVWKRHFRAAAAATSLCQPRSFYSSELCWGSGVKHEHIRRRPGPKGAANPMGSRQSTAVSQLMCQGLGDAAD